MRNAGFFVVFFLLSSTLLSQSFDQFLNHLTSLPVNERQAAVNRFINGIHRFPLIEYDTLVRFIYQRPGQKVSLQSDTVIHVTMEAPFQRVSIAGDFTGWQPTMEMKTIPGTNLWYADASFESNARVEYKFVINGKDWIMDPKNPLSGKGGYGSNSELRMPEYGTPPELDYDPAIPHGTIEDTVFRSDDPSKPRTVRVYLPPGYANNSKKYPVMLFHDGSDYITFAEANVILDWLIDHHEIEPLIGIFVDPVDRENEYSGKKVKPFTNFIIHDLMPVMERKYAISMDPHKRATLGASLGGNIALSLGITNPECFGNIAAQSSAVSKEVNNSYKNGKKKDLVLYMDLGKYDLYHLIPMVHNFIPVLKRKKYEFHYYEFPEGHSWGNWKAHLEIGRAHV